MTCNVPDHLPWLSQWALDAWLQGSLTDIGFIYYFSRMASHLLPVAECLVRSTH